LHEKRGVVAKGGLTRLIRAKVILTDLIKSLGWSLSASSSKRAPYECSDGGLGELMDVIEFVI
jgi:hypothetical protein